MPDKLRAGDNLGNHTATQNLNLGSYELVGNGSAEGVAVSSKGGLILGRVSTNVLLGYQAGNVLTGQYNLLSGYQSGLQMTTGSYNTFGGYQAGYNTTTGQHNTFFGFQAGLNNTTGSGNYALGYGAGPTSSNLTNAGAIGYNAQVSSSNALVLGGTGLFAVKVGIGTRDPQRTLDVNGSIKQATYNSGSTPIVMAAGASVSYTWAHNLGYRPTLMVTLDQTGGGAEYVGVSYEHLTNNTVRFWLRNNQSSGAATFIVSRIRVD